MLLVAARTGIGVIHSPHCMTALYNIIQWQYLRPTCMTGFATRSDATQIGWNETAIYSHWLTDLRHETEITHKDENNFDILKLINF